jgi:RNA polymerase subunit RPABC4/transcription elongation factor Spt4
MERRTFYGPDIDLATLAHSLADSFSRQGYKTQVMQGPNAGFVVQAGKEDTLRKIAGMATALTAIFTMENEYVCAEVGGAKWLEKGVTAGVGALLFFPALITAGVGAFQQSQLQTHAWQFIEQYIRTNSAFAGSPVPGGAAGFPLQAPHYQGGPGAPAFGGVPAPHGPPAPVNMAGAGGGAGASAGGTVCAKCSQPLPPGSKFCLACGAPASKACFGCGQSLSADARFCNHCGSPVSA